MFIKVGFRRKSEANTSLSQTKPEQKAAKIIVVQEKKSGASPKETERRQCSKPARFFSNVTMTAEVIKGGPRSTCKARIEETNVDAWRHGRCEKWAKLSNVFHNFGEIEED